MNITQNHIMSNLNILFFFCFVLSNVSPKFTYGKASRSQCFGSLLITYEDDQNIFQDITLRDYRIAYPNIKVGFPSVRYSFIASLETFGDCCWKIYSKRKFKGEMQVIYPTEDLFYADFQPISIKKVNCI